MTVSELGQALSQRAPNAPVKFLAPSTSGGDLQEVVAVRTSEDEQGRLFVELIEENRR